MDLLKSENVTKEFHKACIAGNLKEVKALLSLKERIDVKQLDEDHTLSEVVRKKNVDIVKILIGLGVNVNKQGVSPIAPLHWAVASPNNLPVAKILIQNGANLDAIVEGFNHTPLLFASDYGNVGTVKLLLENGCKTGIRNQNGWTALENAMSNGHTEVVKLFVFHGK